jgi:antitoxin component of RelBE/YafQ-DinJ toxin-antitoxin module
MRTILQVPMDQKVRDNAEKAASAQGFSSLQEMVRVFLAKLAENKVEVTIQESIKLSEKNDQRYAKMTEDFKKGKNIYAAQDMDDFLKQLNGD